MDEFGSGPVKPLRRHLLTPEALARGARIGEGADLTRKHGQSNGVRIHTLVFAVLSLLTILVIIAAVAFTSPMA